MLQKPTECVGCPLYEIGEGFAPPEGNGSYRVALCGESLGEHEAREGKPFRPSAPAGSVLDRLLRRAGLARDGFIIHNTVNCRPPKNWLLGSPWEAGAVAHCATHRARMFEETRPKVFIALGNVALSALTSYGSGKTTISHVQGYVLDGPYDGTHVIGTFHPSALMQGLQGLSGVAIWAIQRAIDIAKHGFAREPVDVIPYPGLDDMLTFERGWSPESMRLDFDIETPESGELDEEDLAEEDDEDAPQRDISYTIIRASLCYGGRAVSFPWQSPYKEVATRMLGRTVRAAVWNEDFDVPRLRAAGAPVAGRVYDFMKLWKHLQPNLPTKLKCRSLEFVTPFYWHTAEPWKHLNHGQPEYYNACDAIALSKCGDGIERDLRAKGQWDLFERHVVDCYQVLTRMAANGLPYDKVRASEFEKELTDKFDERHTHLQAVVPVDLKRPKQKEGYKKPPKADDPRTADLQLRTFHVLGQDMTEAEIAASGHALISPFEIYDIQRYCLVEPFNPGSPGEDGQVADLVRFYGHKIGTNRKTKRGSVDDDTLKKLQKKLRASRKPRDIEFAGVLQVVRECRQLKKVLGTYIGGWQPGRDGRIHATPGFWGRMYRISWRRPNISATIQDKNEEYVAGGFRKCVAVPPGHMLIECVAPETKILCSDLNWVRADELKIGTELLAFDENPVKAKHGVTRSFRPSVVTKLASQVQPRVRVVTTQGEITVSLNHLFLVKRNRNNHRWVKAQNVRPQDTIAFLSEPWEYDTSREAGYLAGFFDGEGWCSKTRVGFAQNSGPTLDYVESLLRDKRIDFGYYPQLDKKRPKRTVNVGHIWSMYGAMRFLGMIKPFRLMRRARELWENRRTWGKRTLVAEVISVDPVADGEVIGIETTTKTYISNGFFSHNCDWKGIEAVLCGWFAGDEEYMRLARLGVHDYVTWLVLADKGKVLQSDVPDLAWSDADLKCAFKEIKHLFPKDRDDCKHIVHGSNYLGTARYLAELYELREALVKEVQASYFARFDKLRKWQSATLDRASKECKLRNPFGYEMTFWEVMKWDSKRKAQGLDPWVLGEDAKSAIAFLPRDTAAAMLKEVLLRLRPLAEDGVLLASTHDSLTCEVEEARVMEIARLLKTEMERGVPELGGLQIGVEVKVGPAWHDSCMETLELGESLVTAA